MFEHTTRTTGKIWRNRPDGLHCIMVTMQNFTRVGRVEMLRSLGLTYSGMEEAGVKMPVLEMHSKYLKPALYDEEITIRVIMENMPGIRIHFQV